MSNYKENSLEGFKHSLFYKPYGIEMDVVVYDDQLHIYHPHSQTQLYGDSVDSAIKNELDAMSSQDLEVLRLTKYIPELVLGTEFVLLDLKQRDPHVVSRIVSAVKNLNLHKSQIVVGARDMERLRLLIEYDINAEIVSLSTDTDSYEAFVHAGAKYIRLWDNDLTRANIQQIHRMGAEVWVTPGHPTTRDEKGTSGEVTHERLIEIQDSGADAVLVNDIASAREVIK